MRQNLLAVKTLAFTLLLATPLAAQQPGVPRQPQRPVPPAGQAYPQAGPRVAPQAGVPYVAAAPGGQQLPPAAAAQAPEHPVMPILQWAEGAQRQLENVADYSCTFVKRERIDGELSPHQHLFLKVRHKPFSVYVYYLGPEAKKGTEAIYVEGRNGGNILAHTTGIKDTLVGTLTLKPDSAMAMEGNRRPITEIGVLKLTRKTIDACHRGLQYPDVDVRFIPGAKLNGRQCTCMQSTHRAPRRDYAYHMTRLFVDDELGCPIRYEAYGFPAKAGEQPPLEEEYTYLNLKFNNGFTDADYDPKNPNYRFR
jgi:hypothetical protein